MAFMPHAYLDGEVRPWTYLAVTAGTYTVGKYIPAVNAVSMANKTIATGDLLPVVLVDKDVIFDAPLTVASSSIAVGTAYTVASTGDGITATTTDGNFVVTEFDGKAKDDHVRGYFNK